MNDASASNRADATPSPRVKLALGAGIFAMLVLGTGGMLVPSASGGPEGEVRLVVPGAMSISVHCGEITTHGDGSEISFRPDGSLCDVEAPLTPVMPLRGELQLGASSAYRCEREGVDLVCGPEPG